MDRCVAKIEFNSHFEKLLGKHIKSVPAKEKVAVAEKFEIFTKNIFDPRLKTHKLQGRMAGKWAFSISKKDRVAFIFISDNHVLLLDVGDHDIYK